MKRIAAKTAPENHLLARAGFDPKFVRQIGIAGVVDGEIDGFRIPVAAGEINARIVQSEKALKTDIGKSQPPGPRIVGEKDVPFLFAEDDPAAAPFP